MDDDVVVASCVVIDAVLTAAGHRDRALARVGDAEVPTVAVVAAACVQHRRGRAWPVRAGRRSPSGARSASRFNRRWPALAPWAEALPEALGALGALVAVGEAFVRDGRPPPVCRRGRARRCRTVRGQAYRGDGAAKRERFFGWRLHLAAPPAGVPVAGSPLPGGPHAPTPVHEPTVGLPAGASAGGDKAFNGKADEAGIRAATGVRWVPRRRTHMAPTTWLERVALRAHRTRIEPATGQLAAMGRQRRRARTNAGFERKVHASPGALTFLNLVD